MQISEASNARKCLKDKFQVLSMIKPIDLSYKESWKQFKALSLKQMIKLRVKIKEKEKEKNISEQTISKRKVKESRID